MQQQQHIHELCKVLVIFSAKAKLVPRLPLKASRVHIAGRVIQHGMLAVGTCKANVINLVEHPVATITRRKCLQGEHQY